ncbi:MAG: class I SAM-dependent methyltransferase [Candidatus Competibacteraceae bacterium]|nr:class I SAM-dependent methyltransferase [Candidatus Competibacteraceae bacterium]MCB1803912.1 class I SAM-dependent methyltransferase [Candidatus Competibacteraceae bacterium]MCB1812335.1 class I SAM-dependent methyltransferase [Candidatus Competibacteraceae bacterium]
MNGISNGQINRHAAQVYDAFFAPALFAEWASRLADVAQLEPGQTVLDVACGTGLCARAALARVRPDGKVSGLDCNPDMLAVANRQEPRIDWRLGRAESLPYADASFDVVACQFGLMFFEDRSAALRDMWRVLKPGGRLVVAVWDILEHTPGYAAMTALLLRLFGQSIANELRAPFVLGDPDKLRDLFTAAGISPIEHTRIVGTACFPSLHDWVQTDIKGWTLADKIDDTQFALLLDEADTELGRFRRADGSVVFDSPAHIVSARK